ncbi:MAG: hypothetical protein IPG45_14135 [Deltaproteobacteria bacterium]|nr:hypothetical protein [Deltaproteobacteria bacterium]
MTRSISKNGPDLSTIEGYARGITDDLESKLKEVSRYEQLQPSEVLAKALAKLDTPHAKENYDFIRDALSALQDMQNQWMAATSIGGQHALQTALDIANALPSRALAAWVPAQLGLEHLPRAVAEQVQREQGSTPLEVQVAKAYHFSKSPLHGSPDSAKYLRAILESNRTPEQVAALLSPTTREALALYAALPAQGAKLLETNSAAQAQAGQLLQTLLYPAKAEEARAGGEDGLKQAVRQQLNFRLGGSLPINVRAIQAVLDTASLQGLLDLYGDPSGKERSAFICHLNGEYTPGLRTPFTGALKMALNTELPLEERKQRLELAARATELGRTLLSDAFRGLEQRGSIDVRAETLAGELRRLGLAADPMAIVKSSGDERDQLFLQLSERWAARVDGLIASDRGKDNLVSQLAHLLGTSSDHRAFRVVVDGLFSGRMEPPITKDGLRFPFKLERHDPERILDVGILPNSGPLASPEAKSYLKQQLQAAFYVMTAEQRQAFSSL